jgi:hypothetical protein
VSKKIHLGGGEDTLPFVQDQARRLQLAQHLLQVDLMLLLGLTGDEDIIEIHKAVIQAPHDLVH